MRTPTEAFRWTGSRRPGPAGCFSHRATEEVESDDAAVRALQGGDSGGSDRGAAGDPAVQAVQRGGGQRLQGEVQPGRAEQGEQSEAELRQHHPAQDAAEDRAARVMRVGSRARKRPFWLESRL